MTIKDNLLIYSIILDMDGQERYGEIGLQRLLVNNGMAVKCDKCHSPIWENCTSQELQDNIDGESIEEYLLYKCFICNETIKVKRQNNKKDKKVDYPKILTVKSDIRNDVTIKVFTKELNKRKNNNLVRYKFKLPTTKGIPNIVRNEIEDIRCICGGNQFIEDKEQLICNGCKKQIFIITE